MKQYLIAGMMLMLSAVSFAKDPDDSTAAIQSLLARIDSIESKLNYRTGKISLHGGAIELNIPAGFRFLESKDAKYIVEEVWGNPPSAEAPLGLLVPADESASIASYSFIVSYDAMGYVKDDDAKDINYEDLMKGMKESSIEENKERDQLGLDRLNLIGWAAKPYYDANTKVLHWAKEYSVPGQEGNTLNYDIRVLGRRGVLTLQAVADMNYLDTVNAHIPDVLNIASFTAGNKYSDFDSGTDNVAAWTVGGLVAGKVLAKAGFFAVIAKFAKFIFLGIAVAGGAIWRFITGRKKNEEEFVYEPSPAPVPVDDNEPKA